MEKVLVTGCAGLLGSHFCRYLLDLGYKVVGIDNLSGGYFEFVDSRVSFYQQDLSNLKSVEKIFESESPDYVFHFAAYAAEGLSHWIRNFNYTNNVLCSVNVINCCIKYDVQKIIFTSSMAVYGNQSPPFTEVMKPAPEDPYGIAKYSVEQDLRAASDHFGLRYSIVRPHNVIGIRQNIWDRYRNVIGIWIRQVLSGKNISIFGDGLQERAFSDIKYYMEPFRKLLFEGDGEIFNMGADKEITILEAARMIQSIGKTHGYESDIIHYEPRKEVKFAYCDQSKAKKILGLEDRTVLLDTFNEMFEWALECPSRNVKNIKYEIGNEMYSFWR
jgi:UDP-glucose 4-epimerase